VVHPPGHEHDEHAVGPRDGARDHLRVVGRSRHNLDQIAIAVELADALLAAHRDDLAAAVERVMDHVPAELAGRSDNAGPHRSPLERGAY